jgi:hypothetical protein
VVVGEEGGDSSNIIVDVHYFWGGLRMSFAYVCTISKQVVTMGVLLGSG